jgi:hypothetical protein
LNFTKKNVGRCLERGERKGSGETGEERRGEERRGEERRKFRVFIFSVLSYESL